MRRILITGGTGFVGPYLIRFLKSFDAKFTVVSATTLIRDPRLTIAKLTFATRMMSVQLFAR